MSDAIIVANAGSSSLKFSIYAADQQLNLVARGQVEGLAEAVKAMWPQARLQPW